MRISDYATAGLSYCPVCRVPRTENGQCLCDGSAPAPSPENAKDRQIGGDHYKTMRIQPAEFIMANNLGWAEGTAIAYIARWPLKNGVEDLKKARHVLDLLIEHVERDAEIGGQ